MSCFGRGLLPRTGSAFTADALGNQVPKLPAKRGAPGARIPALVRCPVPSCLSGHAYETLTIPGFLAPNPDQTYLPVRVVDSVATLHGVASVGTALSTESWQLEGFVVQRRGSCAGATVKAAILQAYTSVGDAYLDAPTAVVLDPSDGSLIIVGTGYIIDLTGTRSATLPAVARVDADTLSVFVQVGNGDTLVDEQYSDVIVSPACAAVPGFIVCGASGVDRVATVRLLNPVSLLPVPIAGTGVAYTLLTDAALYPPYTFVQSAAVTLAASESVGIVVVGVQATIENADTAAVTQSSLLWTLRLDGSPLYPLSVTSFNNLATFFLNTPASVDQLTIVSVHISSGGTTYAVSSGRSTAGAPLPATVTVVHAFNADTLPIDGFGTAGIVTWFDPESLSSFPVSATLSTYEGQLLVVGNSFNPTAVAGPDTTAIYPPQQPYLEVDVPASGTALLGSVSTPFLLRVGCNGATCQLLRGLGCSSCSTFTWATAFVFTAPGQGVLLGDYGTKPLAYGQPAGLLAAELHLAGTAARVQNDNRLLQEAVIASCDGVVAVDTHCSPTVMVVNGPIVVGEAVGAQPAVPGAIRFVDGRFSGYNGTEWVFLDCCPP
jgi:hypothetical protein